MFGIHRQCKNIYDNRFKYGDAVVNKFGRKGKIHSLENNKASITLDGKKSTILNQSQIVAQ